ncbi:nuclear transport factor 2 family protein [Mucilaginibacter sp. BT774]|uniref:nuclear transport factor 2 family protein n=1 Tax=Mucilaginibacter sp. BT774 TaxID=3062276 RepID=UPI002675C37B|nr:nuclear transport factor 2 family protein [Mucilaginibacter sp. BT774]MDO3625073.1 nuclear transport factor 2 family protein [Mucilaginibacter sp. BT774]
MKTLKTVMMGLALFFVCTVSQATSIGHNNLSKSEVLDTYLNAVVHGKIAGIDDAIDNNATFYMKRGDDINTLTKAQIISTLKSSENIEQDCQCVKTVLQDDDDISKVKVEMKYKDFTRIDVITASRDGKTWQITSVETSYK